MKYYLRTACGIILGTMACVQGLGATAHHDSCIQEGWKEEIPQPVYPDKDLVDLYHKTWEITAGRVRKGPEGLPGSPYMDENCYEDQIWIWDTCFMVLFAKYAPNSFPGEGSMDNLYKPIWDKEKTPLRIHLVDNPPLFAWVEKEYYDFTGNKNRIHEILNRKQYLQKHFDWFANAKAGERFECSPQNIHLNAIGEDGFTWTGGASGMDNTPRGRDAGGYNKIRWIDASSQQALSARCMAQLEQSLGNAGAAGNWEAVYRKLKDKINELYWDEQDGFYYDVAIESRQPCRIRTMASYWPLLAGVASPAQAEKMVKYLRDPQEFGGNYPTPTLSRRDRDYHDQTGDYWRGGIWLPTTYMTVKALEEYGYHEEADMIAEKIIRQQLAAYHGIKPHTIWECYSPSANEPSTEHGRRARPEFCGWSALGPISLFIENVLGFHKVSALRNEIQWRLKREKGRHGLKNLHFGTTTTDIVFDGKNTVDVTSNNPYSLVINGKKYAIKPGTASITLK